MDVGDKCSLLFHADVRDGIVAACVAHGATVTLTPDDPSAWSRAVVDLGAHAVVLTSLAFVARGDALSKTLLGLYNHVHGRADLAPDVKKEAVDFVLRTRLLVGVLGQGRDVHDDPVRGLVNHLAAQVGGRVFDGMDVLPEI